jgi:hypothetical protein
VYLSVTSLFFIYSFSSCLFPLLSPFLSFYLSLFIYRASFERGANNACLSTRMSQLNKRWTDLDEIWYGRLEVRTANIRAVTDQAGVRIPT